VSPALRVVGPKARGFAKRAKRLLVATERGEGQPGAVMRVGVAGIDTGGFTERRQRARGHPELQSHPGEKLVRVRHAREEHRVALVLAQRIAPPSVALVSLRQRQTSAGIGGTQPDQPLERSHRLAGGARLERQAPIAEQRGGVVRNQADGVATHTEGHARVAGVHASDRSIGRTARSRRSRGERLRGGRKRNEQEDEREP
jgi:hypothetical protein